MYGVPIMTILVRKGIGSGLSDTMVMKRYCSRTSSILISALRCSA